MDATTLPFQNYSRVKHRFNMEPPFAEPFLSKVDTAVTRSHVSLPSPAPSLVHSPSSSRSQHHYCLTNGNGKGQDRPWLSLHLSSRSPKSEYLPMFIGKDAISGTVELNLTKPENIREVIVTLRGETTHLLEEPRPFLEMSRSLLRHQSGKLTGRHSHAFSFILPDDVTVDESNWAMVYPIPPKFHEKGILYIDYKLQVTVRRGLFSVDNSLTTNIVYIPETVAECPSELRERVPFDDRPMTLPTSDPTGWKLLPPVEAVGTLIPNATVIAQLSIANPLSFAIGTPIPLFLDIRKDEAAHFTLDSIDVRLVRTLITRNATGGERRLEVARAVFWSAQNWSPCRIRLWGEVVATKRLTPSFDFSKCSVRYSIMFYPRNSPEETKCQPLLEEPVFLTLCSAPGVVPRSHAPPGITAAPIEHQRSIPSRLFPVDHGMVLI